MHRTVQRITADIEACKFNTAVAALMECLNEMTAHHRSQGTTEGLAEAMQTFILMVAPFAPHIAEELWARVGGPYSVHQQDWPRWEESITDVETVTLVVQVDGKVRDRLTVPAGITKAEAKERAEGRESIRRHLSGRRTSRVIYVPDRLVNLVTTQDTGQ
jgi:leucyl-tRNA synthetase